MNEKVYANINGKAGNQRRKENYAKKVWFQAFNSINFSFIFAFKKFHWNFLAIKFISFWRCFYLCKNIQKIVEGKLLAIGTREGKRGHWQWFRLICCLFAQGLRVDGGEFSGKLSRLQWVHTQQTSRWKENEIFYDGSSWVFIKRLTV